jgi:ABC-type transport system involved in multi-copper enzyme maturation permease subunit
MSPILASQWTKLRRPGMLAALAAGVAVASLGTVLTVLGAGSTDAPGGRGPRARGLTVAELTSSHGLGDALTRLSTLLGVIVLGVAASVLASEYTLGTLRNLLVWEPRRIRLATGTWLALTLATTAAVALACIVAVAAGTLAATPAGHPTDAWWSTAGISDLAATIADLILAASGWTLFGALLAQAFRSPVTATAVGIAYALPFETILTNVSTDLGRWLPGQLLTTLAEGGSSTTSSTAALLTLTAYAIPCSGLALWSFQRQDVAL